MAEIRINATGGLKLYDADDSHYAQILAGTITSNTDVMTLGHAAVVMGTKLDMNGNNLVLDADADTYLDTGTDDTIKFYVSGAHDLTISANAINVLSGTTLTIDSGATITNSGTANGFGGVTALNNATANELVTVGATTTELDAESGLTYTDGALVIGGTTPSLTIGDAGAEDTKIVFDGNAQDFHIGLDDSADDLVIGLGSALGTTTHMSFDEAGHINMPLQSSFFAYPDTTISNIATGSQQTPDVGNAEVWDLNADFNISNNTFTAPVTGKYLFTVHLEMKSVDSACSEYAGRLVTSNRTYEFVSLDARMFDADGFMPWLGTIIADMDAADTALIKVLQSDGTAQMDITGGATRTWFQGCLLH